MLSDDCSTLSWWMETELLTLAEGKPEASNAFSTFFLSSLFCANIFVMLKHSTHQIYYSLCLKIYVKKTVILLLSNKLFEMKVWTARDLFIYFTKPKIWFHKLDKLLPCFTTANKWFIWWSRYSTVLFVRDIRCKT